MRNGSVTDLGMLCLHFFRIVQTQKPSLAISLSSHYLLSIYLVWILNDEIRLLLAIETHCEYSEFTLRITGLFA